MKDAVTFYEAIANTIAEQYLKGINEKNFFTLVLTGGNTPLKLFDLLVKNYSERIDWSKVYLFWADERCVSQKSYDNNFFNAKIHLINHLQFGGINPIQTNLSPKLAAKEYLNDVHLFLKKYSLKSFDMVILGMGNDGHIASVFNPMDQKEDEIYVSKTKNFDRVTMSISMLKKIKYKLLMIRGKDKLNCLKDQSMKLPKDMINYEKIIYTNDTFQ